MLTKCKTGVDRALTKMLTYVERDYEEAPKQYFLHNFQHNPNQIPNENRNRILNKITNKNLNKILSNISAKS